MDDDQPSHDDFFEYLLHEASVSIVTLDQDESDDRDAEDGPDFSIISMYTHFLIVNFLLLIILIGNGAYLCLI
jgi:hypothetical protein